MTYTGLTRGGKTWTPEFLISISAETCIGCGRCFKVCGHEVLEMIGIDEDGDECDPFDDDAERKVMRVANGDNCTGCGACGNICGTDAQTHESMDVAAA